MMLGQETRLDNVLRIWGRQLCVVFRVSNLVRGEKLQDGKAASDCLKSHNTGHVLPTNIQTNKIKDALGVNYSTSANI